MLVEMTRVSQGDNNILWQLCLDGILQEFTITATEEGVTTDGAPVFEDAKEKAQFEHLLLVAEMGYRSFAAGDSTPQGDGVLIAMARTWKRKGGGD